ncbi:MAG: hypothetical protein K2N51_15095 [Lachnospiraceae bacterium]|nr:hypothetical protein [Lachnospiraceae bacterium]
MTTIDKIEQGVADYLDAELMPKLQSNGIEKVIVGTAVSLLIRKSGAIIEGYKENKLVKMLGIMDEAGNVDVDILVEELKKNISKDGVKVDIPIIGTLTFHKEDIDKLYNYIMA